MAIIKGQDVFDSYQQVLPKAAALADTYLSGIASSIKSQELPVQVFTENASSGLFQAALGKSREFLVVQPTNRKLDVFRMLHYGVPSGSNLAAGWFLTGRVRGLGQAQFRVPVIHDLDVFDNADLQALVVGIHQFAVIESILSMASRVGYGRERVNQRTSGLFGVS